MQKLSKKQIEKLKAYWVKAQNAKTDYYNALQKLEKEMSSELGIKDLEFFFCDGLVGIGNGSRTINLVTYEQLEDKK